jgi:hypothetical protein
VLTLSILVFHHVNPRFRSWGLCRPFVGIAGATKHGIQVDCNFPGGNIVLEAIRRDDVFRNRSQGTDPSERLQEKKAEESGHGDCHYLVPRGFYRCVRTGSPSPIDVYDAAAWSVILPLSGKLVAEGGTPQEIPDFTRGKWEGGM